MKKIREEEKIEKSKKESHKGLVRMLGNQGIKEKPEKVLGE